jgi:reactive intermediate/imine deaminase
MKAIQTDKAPKAIGSYSQAIVCGQTVYLSGQIPLNPKTMVLCSEDIREQIIQVFENLSQVCQAAGGALSSIVKLTIYLIDLGHFSVLNDIMMQYFDAPYPARAVIGVAGLPRGAQIEMEGIMDLGCNEVL